MLITCIALAIMAATVALVVVNLRHVARDTAHTLRVITTRARAAGQLWSNICFALLWTLIFGLCYA